MTNNNGFWSGIGLGATLIYFSKKSNRQKLLAKVTALDKRSLFIGIAISLSIFYLIVTTIFAMFQSWFLLGTVIGVLICYFVRSIPKVIQSSAIGDDSEAVISVGDNTRSLEYEGYKHKIDYPALAIGIGIGAGIIGRIISLILIIGISLVVLDLIHIDITESHTSNYNGFIVGTVTGMVTYSLVRSRPIKNMIASITKMDNVKFFLGLGIINIALPWIVIITVVLLFTGTVASRWHDTAHREQDRERIIEQRAQIQRKREEMVEKVAGRLERKSGVGQTIAVPEVESSTKIDQRSDVSDWTMMIKSNDEVFEYHTTVIPAEAGIQI